MPVIPEHSKLAGSTCSCTSSTVCRVESTLGGSTVCTDPAFNDSSLRKATSDSNKHPNTDDGRSSLHVEGGGNITSESGAFKRFSFNLSGYARPALLDNFECKPADALESKKYIHVELRPVCDSRLISTSKFHDKRPKDVHVCNILHLS